jgi:hypothetical protein
MGEWRYSYWQLPFWKRRAYNLFVGNPNGTK